MQQARAQESDIELTFVKDSNTISSTELYFNILRISNLSEKPISGEVVFHAPIDWKIVSFPEIKTTIQPHDTLSVPIRVAPSPNAIGNITYILSASFKTKNKVYVQSACLNIPSVSKWEMRTNHGKEILVTKDNPNTNINISLANKGNTNELIKLEYTLGQLTAFPFYNNTKNDRQYIEYIQLPAQTDTVISRPVMYKLNIPYSEQERYKNNWRESTIQIKASTGAATTESTVAIRELQDTYVNERAQSNTPLNVDYTMSNIMSGQDVSNNIRLYGTLLLRGESELQYYAGTNNVYFGDNSHFDYNRQLIYNFIYQDQHNYVQLGYNIGNRSLHALHGRGVTGTYTLNSLHQFSYSAIQNPYTRNIGGEIGYNTRIKRFGFNTAVTYETNLENRYWATSLSLGTSVTFLKRHSISLQLLGSLVNYQQTVDTLVFGFSGRFAYAYRGKDVDIRLSAISSLGNYIQNAGRQQIYLDGKYKIKDDLRLVLYGNSLYYSTARYPNAFTQPSGYNMTNNGRLTLAYQIGKTTLQAGPNYMEFSRQTYNTYSQFLKTYHTHQPGIWMSVAQKLNNYSSISPNVTVGYMLMQYKTTDPSEVDYVWNKGFYYSVGLNFYSEHWKVNAAYTNGSAGDLYYMMEIYGAATATSSLQIRPMYETWFFRKKGRLSASVNYGFYLPSKRQAITCNLQYQHQFNHGWNAYASGYVFSNSREAEGVRTSTTSLNLVLGVRKSFNIQQPRQKYYDINAILFNDLDGNRIKSDDEPPVQNVCVNISKYGKSDKKTNLQHIELVSNSDGKIQVQDMPADEYTMSFQPLINLESYYFFDGQAQHFRHDKNQTLYIPLVESYKVKGKVLVIRDPNSSEGILKLDGIRITAIAENGEIYSALTDNQGNYILHIPNGKRYTLKIANVFGEHFSIAADEVIVQFTSSKTVHVDFTFLEKRREINFGAGNLMRQLNQPQ